MSLSADLFWSFRSPYSYLAIGRYRALMASHDVTINLRPVYPLAVRQPDFFERNHPNWLSYTMRDMIRMCLVPAGFDVHLAEDGVDGIEVLDGLDPDAIITDINMPRMDGFGFIDAVRSQEEHRATPILVLTTESAPELKQRARNAGATGWIVKPFDPQKLVKALTMVTG